MRWLRSPVTMAGMSRYPSPLACCRAMSMAMYVPLLPTPALEVGVAGRGEEGRGKEEWGGRKGY